MSEATPLKSGYWHISDFACSCADDGDAEMHELFLWAKNREYKNEEDWKEYKRYFLDRIFTDLSNYHVSIETIAYDQWGVIIATTGAKLKKPTSYFIQFDRFEDGLFLLLKRVVEFYTNEEDYQLVKDGTNS